MKPPPPNALANRVVFLLLLLFIFSGTLGLGAVAMRQQIFRTANQNRVIEGQLADVTRKLDEVRAQVATAENVQSLLRQNNAMRLGLGSPQERQVVRVDRDPTIELARKRNAESLISAANEGSGNALAIRYERASYRR